MQYLRGPIAVGFESHGAFHQYEGGIFDTLEDNPYYENEWVYTDHLVLAIGFGEEDGVPYWICKNSWVRTHCPAEPSCARC